MRVFASLVPGVALAGGLATAAWWTSSLVPASGWGVPVSPLMAGVIVGMLMANVVDLPPLFAPGIRFVAQRVLRLAIVLMGLRLTFGQVASVGVQALAVVAVGSGLTLGFTLALGRWLKLPVKRTLLLASGTSVCGAAAIAAVDGCVKAPAEDVGFALAAVTLFGTLGVFVYPEAMAALGFSERGYALWTGASLHEVAQVAAAASVLAPAGQALASTVKLVRVLLILPLTMGLSVFPRVFGIEPSPTGGTKISVPWFALAFFAVSLVFSFPLLPRGVTDGLLVLDNGLLTAAMVALGLGIRFKSFRKMNARSLWLAFLPTLFLSVVTAVVTGLVMGL